MQRGKFVGLMLGPLLAMPVAAEDKIDPVFPANYKAIAVRVDPTDQAGLILPGSRVDVLLTKKLDGEKTETKTILTNVMVVAVDQFEQNEKLVLTITLAVLPADAMR